MAQNSLEDILSRQTQNIGSRPVLPTDVDETNIPEGVPPEIVNQAVEEVRASGELEDENGGFNFKAIMAALAPLLGAGLGAGIGAIAGGKSGARTGLEAGLTGGVGFSRGFQQQEQRNQEQENIETEFALTEAEKKATADFRAASLAGDIDAKKAAADAVKTASADRSKRLDEIIRQGIAEEERAEEERAATAEHRQTIVEGGIQGRKEASDRGIAATNLDILQNKAQITRDELSSEVAQERADTATTLKIEEIVARTLDRQLDLPEANRKSESQIRMELDVRLNRREPEEDRVGDFVRFTKDKFPNDLAAQKKEVDDSVSLDAKQKEEARDILGIGDKPKRTLFGRSTFDPIQSRIEEADQQDLLRQLSARGAPTQGSQGFNRGLTSTLRRN